MGGTPGLPPAGQPAPLRADEFQPGSVSQVTTFDVRDVQPPTQVFIQRDDTVVIFIASSGTGGVVRVTARVLRTDGVVVPLSADIAIASAAGFQQNPFPLTEGYLLSLAMMTVGHSDTFPCYVRAVLFREAQGQNIPTQVLAAGYAENNNPIAYPGMQSLSPHDGGGFTRRFTFGPPAAGAELSVQFPSGFRYRIISCFFTLTTSATAGNRQIVITLDDNNNIFWRFGAAANQAPSTTVNYNLGQAIGPATDIAGDVLIPLPTEATIWNAGSIKTITAALAAGDQYSAMQVASYEYVDQF